MQDHNSLDEVRKLHPADAADLIQKLKPDEAREILHQLPRDVAAQVVAELDPAKTEDLLSKLPSSEVADILEELPPNEAADVAGELSDQKRHEVLKELEAAESKRVIALLKYRSDSAGGIMSDRFISLRPDLTIQEALQEIRKLSQEDAEGIFYLYVTDEHNRLQGVISLRDLVFRNPERKIEEFIKKEVKFVYVDDDQEKIAQLFNHYHYLALPVLERDGRIAGVVEAHQVLDVISAEATEDMQLMVGLSGEETASTPWQKSLGGRLSWLYVNLFTAFIAGAVVGLFENTIAQWTALAIFLPVIAGQGGNAGMQTLTVIIRAMALGEISPGEGKKALRKECILGLINGVAIGIFVGIVGYLWKGNPLLGIIVGLAMLLNMLAAALSGVMVPYLLKSLKIDPALASSILVTTITDVGGFFFFLGLASLSMRWL